MQKAVQHGDITENIAFVTLDDDLFQLLHQTEAREELRAALILEWFPKYQKEVWAAVAEHRKVNQAETELRTLVADTNLEVRESSQTIEVLARSAAFRWLVLKAYDYRCAASGWRIVLPDGGTLIEAAHTVPFFETFNDDPRNGIAHTPTYHTAFDKISSHQGQIRNIMYHRFLMSEFQITGRS